MGSGTKPGSQGGDGVGDTDQYNATAATATNRVEGTLEYVAPEVSRLGGGRAGLASDLWALGCVLYQLLVGRTPVWLPSAPGDAATAVEAGSTVGGGGGDGKAKKTKRERRAARFGSSDVYSEDYDQLQIPG